MYKQVRRGVTMIKDKKRLRPIQKYKIGQWVYVYHENILQRALISGVVFDYNTNSNEMAFKRPEYKVELRLGYMCHYSAIVNENMVFKTKEECVAYALENGLIKQGEIEDDSDNDTN